MSEIDWTANDPIFMGIVNVTPDSFSDGGQYLDARKAIEHGFKLQKQGAHILDIGGESTRPGAAPVSIDEEISRIVPVIEGLKDCGALLSVDTRNAATMRAAIEAGAGMINDVTALEHDQDSLMVAKETGVYVCLMHMKGVPQTMQDAPVYGDVFEEVYAYLKERIDVCLHKGLSRKRLIVDPGIGFGKTLEHNLILLKRLKDFGELGMPLLLGASRKRFIGQLSPEASPEARLPGSLAVCMSAYNKGVRMFRVHDVAETRQALTVYKAIS
jgi:dihydropteroate synthase